MKRLIVLLSIVTLFITGCSVTKLDSSDIGKNMKNLLSEKVKLYNVYYEGYKYYLPKGMSFVDKEEYNAILKDNDNNIYYMYVDAISYYHKVKNDYEVNEKSHYSRKLEYNKRKKPLQQGHLKIFYSVCI